MKNEYYTLKTNGSFHKIDINNFLRKKVEPKKWKKFLNKSTSVISFNLFILLLLGVALIVILSIHISQNVLFTISTLLQVQHFHQRSYNKLFCLGLHIFRPVSSVNYSVVINVHPRSWMFSDLDSISWYYLHIYGEDNTTSVCSLVSDVPVTGRSGGSWSHFHLLQGQS